MIQRENAHRLRAEERFDELSNELSVVSHTYVVALRIRWQGIVNNPLSSFWKQELSEVWTGTEVEEPKPKQPVLFDVESGASQ